MESKKGGLGEKETHLLQRHWKTLKQDIRMGDIVDNLIVENLLKPAQWDDLKRKYNIEKERTEEFLLMLQDEIMKAIKELRDNDTQRQKELVAMQQTQEKSSQEFEKKLAINLKQTNEELNKLKESLKQKEDEIEQMKKIQRQHEESNKILTEQNKKLENEKEKIHGELKLKASEREEMELRMQKHKINEEKVAREKEKLKKKVERQSVQLEQEMLEKNKAMESLKRERTMIDLMKREKTELEERIETLEEENDALSIRPFTATTCRTSRDLDDVGNSTLTLFRRQPTGLSENGDNNSMVQLLDQRSEIEAEIKRKQIEQKYLKRRLKEMQSIEPGSVQSQTCVMQ